jgi:hypothetical protein
MLIGPVIIIIKERKQNAKQWSLSNNNNSSKCP